jgi:hypothetical protein
MKITYEAGHWRVPHRNPFDDHSPINTKRKSKKTTTGDAKISYIPVETPLGTTARFTPEILEPFKMKFI